MFICVHLASEAHRRGLARLLYGSVNKLPNCLAMKACHINLIVFRGRPLDTVVRICRGRPPGGLPSVIPDNRLWKMYILVGGLNKKVINTQTASAKTYQQIQKIFPGGIWC